MSADFYKMQAETFKSEIAQTAETIYLVAAYDAGNKAWSIRRKTSFEEFSSLEAAQKHAESLSPMWTNRTIVKIDLPAKDKTDGPETQS